MVERRLVGGECSYWACMPTKTMLRAPELVAAAAHTLGSIEPATLDPQKVFAWRDVVAERDDSSQVEWLASQNATLVRGDAVVTRAGRRARRPIRSCAYDRLVIATGSSPAIPPIDGLDSIDYWTNVRGDGDDGGARRASSCSAAGPVGCELAQFFQRVGSQVTLVQGDDRILSRVDADAAALVADALREDGVELRLGVHGRVASRRAQLALSDGSDVAFDRLLVATGRRPNVGRPRAARADDQPPRDRGRRADARRRGRLGARRRDRHRAVHPRRQVPRARRRLRHGRPRRARRPPRRSRRRSSPTRRSRRSATPRAASRRPGISRSVPRLSTYERPKRPGFVKVVADPERRVLKGAVAVGPEAGEWLQQLTLAIRAETPIEVLLDVIQPYPTFSEGVFLALRELNLDL